MDEIQTPQAGIAPPEHDARSRARLLRAAADVFDRKGYAAASVREIVERAGITKPALYYHFGSKEGILIAILEEGERLFQQAVARALAHPGGARTRVTALCEEIYSLFRDNVPAVRVAHALYFGPREGLHAFDLTRFERVMRPALQQLVEDGIATGEFRRARPEDLSMAINGVIVGCTDQELSPNATPVGIDGIHRVLDLIFDGLSANRVEKEN